MDFKVINIFILSNLFTFQISAASKSQVEFYDQRYQLESVTQKLVNNRGDGYDALYGVRNFRTVLRGFVYRGGANNYYNKYQNRPNENPLPNMGLTNLCEEGFKTSIYLYDVNFDSAPKKTSCRSHANQESRLDYQQILALDETQTDTFLEMFYKAINGEGPSPIYIHCFNGWHASGLISAIALQQFCEYTPAQALDYWVQNTDGNDKGYDKLKKRILNFKQRSQFKITAEQKKRVCF